MKEEEKNYTELYNGVIMLRTGKFEGKEVWLRKQHRVSLMQWLALLTM